jgi:uncharacterized protein (TIGR03546 family)
MAVGSIRKLLKGGLSPAHVWSSVVLGFLLGMVPDYAASAGLVAVLVLCSLLIRVNAGLFALSLIVSKTFLLLSLPWLFDLGQAALYGSVGGALLTLSQLPVLAWFGFERYATVGALFVGVPLSLVVALVVNRSIQTMRQAGASLDSNPKFDAFAQSLVGRVSLNLMLGKSAKDGLGSALNNPVPLLRWKEGFVAASLIALLATGVWQWAKSDLKSAVMPVLEGANGATVDVDGLSLNLWTGTLDITGLALADPSDLSVNSFAAAELRISVSSLALLSKRIVVNEVSATDATYGMARETPGQLVGPLIKPPAVSAPSAEDLGGYVNEAEKWLDRLKQLQSWLKKWEGSFPNGPDATPEVGSPSYEEWLEEQITQSGYIKQSFAPIEDGFWSVVAKKVSMESLRIAAFGDKDLTLSAENLASNPKRAALSPRLELTSKDESLGVLLQLNELSGAGANQLSVSADGLDAESTLTSLKPSISKQISGGQIALNVDGEFRYAGDGELNLDLLAALRDAELTVRRRNVPVEELRVPVQIQGSFNAPKIRVENKAIEEQLKNLAEGALKDEAKSRVEEKVKDKLGDLFKRRIR